MLKVLNLLPKDPLFDLQAQFQQDPRPQKINLGIGAYVSEDGSPYVMPTMQKIAEQLPYDNFDYFPIGGSAVFLRQTAELFLGEGTDAQSLACQSTCGGTHACRLFAQLAQQMGIQRVLLPTPTWVNHQNIFSDFSVETLAHLSPDGAFHQQAYLDAIKRVDQPTVLLLHGGSAHNPTGINMTLSELKELAALMKQKPIFVLLDFAYLGLGAGVSSDAEFAQVLFSELQDVALAVSYSKNATLYRHRTGALIMKTNQKEAVESHLQAMVRKTISNPPAFGQQVLVEAFAHHRQAWMNDIDAMRQSIDDRRTQLIASVPALQHLQKSKGLFALLPLSKEQVLFLRETEAVYMPDSGRINLAGVLPSVLPYLAQALRGVMGIGSGRESGICS